MGEHDRPGDGQAQAHPARPTAGPALDPKVALEDARQHRYRNARPGVGYRQLVAADERRANVDAHPATPAGVLQGVLDQIAQCLREPDGVANQRQGPDGQPHQEACPPPPRLGRPFVERPAHHLGQVHVACIDAQSAALPTSQLEQVVRQSDEPPRVAN